MKKNAYCVILFLAICTIVFYSCGKSEAVQPADLGIIGGHHT